MDDHRLEALVSRRDVLIRQLWLIYRDMSDIMSVDDWDDVDLDLWGNVTGHSAVQSQLGGSNLNLSVNSNTKEKP